MRRVGQPFQADSNGQETSIADRISLERLTYGGIKRGQIIGATDKGGYSAIGRSVHPNDLYATILQVLGLDQREPIYEHRSRRELVMANGGKVVRGVFG